MRLIGSVRPATRQSTLGTTFERSTRSTPELPSAGGAGRTKSQAETLRLRFAWGNFLARRGLPPKTAQFFQISHLGEENAYGNNPEVWSAPAASNMPRHCIHPRDSRMAAVAYARHHLDRTIDDSGGYPC